MFSLFSARYFFPFFIKTQRPVEMVSFFSARSFFRFFIKTQKGLWTCFPFFQQDTFSRFSARHTPCRGFFAIFSKTHNRRNASRRFSTRYRDLSKPFLRLFSKTPHCTVEALPFFRQDFTQLLLLFTFAFSWDLFSNTSNYISDATFTFGWLASFFFCMTDVFSGHLHLVEAFSNLHGRLPERETPCASIRSTTMTEFFSRSLTFLQTTMHESGLFFAWPEDGKQR